MKKLAKLTALLLAGIMVLAMLTACNGSGGGNAEAEALGKQYTEQALAILNEYRATQNTEQTPYPQLANDPELLALAEQRLMLIGQDGKILGSDTLYIPDEGKEYLNVWVMIEPFKPGEKGDVTERYPALALTKERLAELNTTKVFGANLPLASTKMLKITKVAFAYRVVGGKAYVAMAFAAPMK